MVHVGGTSAADCWFGRAGSFGDYRDVELHVFK
jgi:hypothetical protein